MISITFTRKIIHFHRQLTFLDRIISKQTSITMNKNSRPIVIICTIILTALSLIFKWILLRPIHNEIVEKFEKNMVLTYERNKICDVLDMNRMNLIIFPLSCVFIIFLVIEGRRKSSSRGVCSVRFGFPAPMDVFSISNRKLIVTIFAICADELLKIVNEVVFSSSSSNSGVIVDYLQKILQVLLMGFRYYPALAAVTRRSFYSLLFGMIYILIEFPINIVENTICQSNFYFSSNASDTEHTSALLDFYGQGSTLLLIQVFSDLPRYFCLSYLSVKISVIFIKRYRQHRHQKNYIDLDKDNIGFIRCARPDSIETNYIRNIFHPKKTRLQVRMTKYND